MYRHNTNSVTLENDLRAPTESGRSNPKHQNNLINDLRGAKRRSNPMLHIFYLSFILYFFLFDSCKDNSVAPQENSQLIYQKEGLVDSAVVHQCVALTLRFFSDTLDLSNYEKIKITFNGLTNSNGSFIKILYNTDTSSNTEIYSVMDISGVNNDHSYTFMRPVNAAWFELRTYINPPV